MISTGYLDELGGDINTVARIVNGLAAAVTNVILVPAVAGHTLMLLACVSKVYQEPVISDEFSDFAFGPLLTVLYFLEIIRPRP